jgi:diacylglycerol O-acyltransferase
MTAAQKFVFPPQMNDADAGFFFLGQRPTCNVAMVMCAVLRERVPFEDMLEELWEASRFVPRFLDRLQPAPFDLAPPVWVPADPFEPRDQLRDHPLPPGATWDDALAVVDALQSTPFSLDRPPWEILQVTGCPGGRALFVMKVHHALSDGTALSLLFAKAFGRAFLEQSGLEVEAISEPPPAVSPARIALAYKSKALKEWGRQARSSLPALRREPEARYRERAAVEALARPRHRQPSSSFGTARRLSGFRIPAETWNQAAAARGGSPNDLYLAVVANAMHLRFPQWNYDSMPLELVMPVDIREEEIQDGGNVTGVSVVELDGRSQHLDDLTEVRRRAAEAKRDAQDAQPTVVGGLVGLLPGRLRGVLQYREFAARDAVATNVPVPIPGELCGVPFETMFMVAPSIGTSASFSLTSYRDSLQVAANVDTAVVPGGLDAEITQTLQAIFGEVESLRDGTLTGPSAGVAP